MADQKLASAGNCIKIWDPAKNYVLDQKYSPHPHTSTVYDISWSCDGLFLASASSGYSGQKLMVSEMNSSNSSEIPSKNGQQCVCCSKSETRYVLSGGMNSEINLCDLKCHQITKIFTGHSAPVTKVQFNHNDATILSGSADGDVILHDVVTGLRSSVLKPPEVQAIRDLKYSDGERCLFASASDKGMIRWWDANSPSVMHSYKEAHNGAVMALAFSPVHGSLLMSVGLDKSIVGFDVNAKGPMKRFRSDQPLTSIDFLNGVTLAVGSMRGKISIFDLRQFAIPIHSFSAHSTSVQCLSFQPVPTPSLVGAASVFQMPQLPNEPPVEKCRQQNEHIHESMSIGDHSHQDLCQSRFSSDHISSPPRDESSPDTEPSDALSAHYPEYDVLDFLPASVESALPDMALEETQVTKEYVKRLIEESVKDFGKLVTKEIQQLRIDLYEIEVLLRRKN